MPQHHPDRALRTLVVKLSTLGEDDVAAILGGLDSAGRRAIEELLQELRSGGAVRSTEQKVEPQPTFDPTRLSPWLCERMDCSGGAAMKPAAYRLLLSSAVRLFPLTATRAVEDAPQRSGMLARLAPLFSKAGAAQ